MRSRGRPCRWGRGKMPEPIDLADIERRHPGALMGCVLLEGARRGQRIAAYNADLTVTVAEKAWPARRTDLGDRVLAALRAKLEPWNPELVDDMMHAVGRKPAAPPDESRNHFVADQNTHAAAGWVVLVSAGLAEEGKRINDGRSRVLRVSDIGRAALALRDRKQQP